MINIIKTLVEHRAEIETAIGAVEKLKDGNPAFLKVARGAIVTAVQNIEEHIKANPTAATEAAPAVEVAADKAVRAPAAVPLPTPKNK